MPERVVEQIALSLVAGLFVCAGVWMAVWPDAAVEQDPDLAENATPAQARRNARVGGVVLVLLGLIGLYVLLVQAPARGPRRFLRVARPAQAMSRPSPPSVWSVSNSRRTWLSP